MEYKKKWHVDAMFVVLLTGCGTATDQPSPVTERPLEIVAVSAEGVVVADDRARAFYGMDRSGREVWRDPEPRSLAGAFARSGARIRRVPTARNASDAVIIESDGAEAGSLRLLRPARPAGEDARIRLKGAMSWAERAYMLTGADKPVPITTTLPVLAGCAAGTQGLVVCTYWRDGDGRRFTGLRGVDSAGRQTWSREIAAEAQIRPSVSVGCRIRHAEVDPQVTGYRLTF
ncbi:hypothetical protein HCN51_51125 [Nonomuraea sp. FMUSA5-5]|uniref:Lipoprotein n=1 Tax=Nonomuraea composti TaxID=2720023 RepID=A0ABX1BN15_9ACTN|nr:hypothetical protein [Nonomuraea sp. FMUSA5-5]NJP97692.1 hypothetical protein [Nonomuraea sp. FMUSA5-5]